ncbi:MAG: SAM-dependent methyltransferase [Clostridiales bacterium]|nr:SAM-dependent methyltransferase [Clostridiales bacterium]
METKSLLLQPRLSCIADMVAPGTRLADVGTDHGYLPVWLLQNNQIKCAIASDVRPEPLKHAKRTAAACGIFQGITFRLCDGLSGIAPGEVDTVAIAGMGGETIAAILSAAEWAHDCTLLLQPMTKVEFLRKWLVDHQYVFQKERLTLDKDFLYPVFQVTGGVQLPLSTLQQYGGVCLQDDPLYGAYLRQRIDRLQTAIDGLNRANDCCSRNKAAELESIRQALEQQREEFT